MLKITSLGSLSKSHFNEITFHHKMNSDEEICIILSLFFDLNLKSPASVIKFGRILVSVWMKKSDFSWRQLNGIYWVGQKPGSQHCWKVCIVEPRMMCNVQCAMCSLEWCALCSPEWRTLTMEICVHCECGVWLWCGVENNEQHKPARLLHRCALNYDNQTQSVMKHSVAVVINLHKFYSHCAGLKEMQDHLWPDRTAKNINQLCKSFCWFSRLKLSVNSFRAK